MAGIYPKPKHKQKSLNLLSKLKLETTLLHSLNTNGKCHDIRARTIFKIKFVNIGVVSCKVPQREQIIGIL